MSQAVLEELQQLFPHHVEETHAHCGDETAVIKRKGLIPVVEFLRDQFGFDMLVDICGNDLSAGEAQFETIYHFLATTNVRRTQWRRIRLKVRTPEGTSVPTLSEHYKAANWYERETWDMYGIPFHGHPALKRILTHWQFAGHPLRKDYPKDKRQAIDAPCPLDWFDVRSHPRDDGSETMVVNIGPAHPMTQGVMRLVAELDGELIADGEVEIGYLHRCFEKEAEAHTWSQILPYTERLNYISAPINPSGYASAVEKLAGIEVTDRCKWMRMLMAELGRIMDHCLFLGAALVDMGALTNEYYLFKIREACTRILDKYAGNRVTGTADRIGGFAIDAYDGFEDDVRALGPLIASYLGDVEKLIAKNRIFLDRTVNVGTISQEDAISYGITGPVGRASGLQYDVRKAAPYWHYDSVDFDVVIGTTGDTHDRLMVRLYEIKESARLLLQALKGLDATRGEPIAVEVPGITLPGTEQIYTDAEALVRHYDIIAQGERIPRGEAYGYTEGANGELGYYLVSDGRGMPQRVHLRPPCFSALQAYTPTIKQLMLADAVVVFRSLNIVAGELDR